MNLRDYGFVFFIAMLFFIFSGEPDLWDKWHDIAIGNYSCAKESK